MLIKEQSSWCFEDRISPTKGRQILEVMDLYTDQQFIDIRLENFLNLNVKRRDLNQDLPFIAAPYPFDSKENQGFIDLVVNLGDLNTYPKALEDSDGNAFKDLDNDVCKYSDNALRHVKLEIEYLNTNPGFEKKPAQMSRNPTGYTCTTRITGPTQHEYSIILPKGMVLDKTNPGPRLYYELPDDAGELKLNINYIEEIESKETCHLLIDEKDYEDQFEILKNPDVVFYLSYSVSNDPRYIVFFPVFSVMMFSFVTILFIPSLIQFISGRVLTLNLIELFSILIPQTIVLFPFTYYYIDSNRRDYEIPFSRFTESVILLAIAVLLLNIILLSATYLKPFG